MRIGNWFVALIATFFTLAPLTASAQEVADLYIGIVMDLSRENNDLYGREIYSASSYPTEEYTVEVEIRGQVVFVSPTVLEQLIRMDEMGALFEVGFTEVSPVTGGEAPPDELSDDGVDFDCKLDGEYWPKGGSAKSSPWECQKACLEWDLCAGWSYKDAECRLFHNVTQSFWTTGSGWYCGYK